MSSVLSYKYPPILPAGGGIRANQEKWNTTLPMNGAVFRSDQSQSIIFNISSNSEFLRTTQSFLTGTLVPRSNDGSEVVNAGTTNSYQGMSRAFNRVVIRFGGVVVEDMQMSDLLAMYYSTASVSKKQILQRMEGFGKTDWFATGKKKFATLLYSSLWITDQALPLPLIASGGITIELFLSPASELFTSANVSYYTIDQPSFKWMGITPDPSYTVSLRSAVASGRSAYIHYQRVHSYPSNGNGSKTQAIVIPIGQVSSIASLDVLFYSEVDYADRTKDKYARFGNAGLIDFRVEGAGLSNPSQLTFKYEGGADPELMMLRLISQAGNAYNMDRDVTLESNFETASFSISLNYQSNNEYAGSGLSTIGAASPFLTVTTTHDQVVQPTTRIVSFVTTDALIEFRGTEIAISEVF